MEKIFKPVLELVLDSELDCCECNTKTKIQIMSKRNYRVMCKKCETIYYVSEVNGEVFITKYSEFIKKKLAA